MLTPCFCHCTSVFNTNDQDLSKLINIFCQVLTSSRYIYIYIYIYVCVCVSIVIYFHTMSSLSCRLDLPFLSLHIPAGLLPCIKIDLIFL